MWLSQNLLMHGAGGGGEGWNLATASYDTVSFGVSAQDDLPVDIAFSGDGTKMYMVGTRNDAVHQYSLSTAWDLSTASYDTVSFSVSAQDVAPEGIAFKSDGTKMYVVGTSSDTVFQYSLSTAWDLSTARYDTVSFSVSAQEGVPQSIAFKGDGTKMYVVGTSSDTVFQYSLSTAWDLSTASYDTVSFIVQGQATSPQSIAFKSDGTKMYVLNGGASDTVFQYSLSAAWDLSTASYDTVSFSVQGQDTVPESIAFKSDGTKMYVVGNSGDAVYQYSLTD